MVGNIKEVAYLLYVIQMENVNLKKAKSSESFRSGSDPEFKLILVCFQCCVACPIRYRHLKSELTS